MELLIKDRLYIPTFLPKENNFKQFNLKKEILRKVAISDEEREEVGLKQITDENRIEWDTNKDTPLIVEMSWNTLNRLVNRFRTNNFRMMYGRLSRKYMTL